MVKPTYAITLLALFTLGGSLPAALAQDTPVTQSNAAAYVGAPFGGKAAPIPGRIEAENYDEGGPGVAYHSRIPNLNEGNGYRKAEGVGIKGMSVGAGPKPLPKSVEGTPTVGWFFVGEWMQYTANVTSGVYDINVRYATPQAGKALDFYLEGALVANVPLPPTGEYTVFKTTTLKNVKLEASGRKVLRLQQSGVEVEEIDVNWVEFVPSAAMYNTPVTAANAAAYAGQPFGGKAATIPGRIEAENYDEGGPGIAFYDRTPEVNEGAGYRKGEGVDLKGMVFVPGRKPYFRSNESTPTVGWFFVGEWMQYTVMASPGTYDLNVRYGTPIDGKAIDVYLGGELLASVPTPPTGEYTIWKTATMKNVKVQGAGRMVLRITQSGKDLDEVDVNWVEFLKTGRN